MNRSQWTKEEIEYLKMSYQSGKRMKVIANDLNRSEMAINKTLHRFHLRSSKEQKGKEKPKGISPSKRVRELRRRSEDDWISLPKMLDWLKDHGSDNVPVYKRKGASQTDPVPLTMGQLLLRCNRLRLSYGLPVFKVKGITNV